MGTRVCWSQEESTALGGQTTSSLSSFFPELSSFLSFFFVFVATLKPLLTRERDVSLALASYGELWSQEVIGLSGLASASVGLTPTS